MISKIGLLEQTRQLNNILSCKFVTFLEKNCMQHAIIFNNLTNIRKSVRNQLIEMFALINNSCFFCRILIYLRCNSLGKVFGHLPIAQ